jgi:hypothetical protein
MMLSLCCISASCAPCRQPSSQPADHNFLPALPNATYPLDITRSGRAALQNGIYEEEAAPGSATRTRITLNDVQVLGDLNGDDLQDAAVILIADPGGSGTFYYLSAVINRNGAPDPVPAVLLGDRVSITSLTIHNGEINVTLLTRQRDEPMAAKPAVELVRTYRLEENLLVEIP